MIEPLSEYEQNIVTKVFNVSKFSLDTCIKTIRESNINAFFYKIKYIEEEQTVIFYTDRKINIEKWEDKNNLKVISNNLDVLKDLKKILLSREIFDSYCISIYDIINLLKEKNNDYLNLANYYKEKIERLVHSKVMKGLNIIVDIEKHKCSKDIISIVINNEPISKKEAIYFYRKDNELKIVNSKSFSLLEEKVFNITKDILFELYEEFDDFFDFKKQYKVNVNSINSNFLVNLNSNQIEMINDGIIIKEFINLFNNNYIIDSNMVYITKLFDKNREEFLKKIYLKIDDCPKWMQEELYNIRQEQLKKEKNNKISIKKKILSLINKI